MLSDHVAVWTSSQLMVCMELRDEAIDAVSISSE